MRVFLLLLVACLIVLVFVDGRKSKDSKSKGSGSKSSSNIGKVTKVRAKPLRHHTSDSSESSEEYSNKHKKKHSEKFKIEERFHLRKGNSTINHMKGPKLNSTTISEGGLNNRTGKASSLTKNVTSHELLKINNTQSTALNENKTLIGWKIFTKPNMSKPLSVNETKIHTLNNFLHNEKSVNGSHLHLSNNNWNNSMTPPGYGWNINTIAPSQGWNNSMIPPGYVWNINTSAPSQGWNINKTAPSYGWNINTIAPSQAWKNNPDPVQGWNIEPSVPDVRKIFSVPDQRKDQTYYFDSPSATGYFQKNPNSISNNNQPAAYPVNTDYNRKMISNMSPEYGWGVPQSSHINNDQYNSDGKMLNSYPIYQNYGSFEKKSYKIPKGVKKVFKKLAKGTGKVLSTDPVKDTVKQAASSYFANPPPNGWIYNPPYGNTKQIFYGSFSNSVRKEPLTADDWRSIIFGNVPRKAQTRNLYSASFPETYQNMNLIAFSGKGRFPDFNQTQSKSFFSRPYYQKIFAGLQNEEVTKNFRAKRELSEKGKAMAAAINKFFLHERDCNDTELNARRKRNLLIRPLPKVSGSSHDEQNKITDFPFSGVEAIVQSDYGVSVYEELPKEIKLDNTSTEKNFLNEDNTIFNEGATEKILFTTQPSYPIIRNRTKLFPVSETVEQFLNKKPTTRLRVIDEPLENWKSNSRSSSSLSLSQSSEAIDLNDENANPTKRMIRSDDASNEPDFTPFYNWNPKLRSSDNEVVKPDFTQFNKESVETSEPTTDIYISGRQIKDNSHYSDEQIPNTQSPILNSEENIDQGKETSSVSSEDSSESPKKTGFYFFGAYISDYDGHKWENLASNESYQAEPTLEITNHVSTPSTDNNDIHTDLMEGSSISAPSYSNREENFPIPAPTEQTLNAHIEPPLSNSYETSKAVETTVYLPFRIHTISFFSYVDYSKKEKRRSTQEYSEPITPGESIIKAPYITNRCGRKQRLVKGRCRTIW